eukprot:scaffold251887_cov22-Tisochrysis_lutea.AAC.1
MGQIRGGGGEWVGRRVLISLGPSSQRRSLCMSGTLPYDEGCGQQVAWRPRCSNDTKLSEQTVEGAGLDSEVEDA